jgi:hypothetical protein
LRMQSTRACRFYLDELHELGAELSLSNTIVGRIPRAARTCRALS